MKITLILTLTLCLLSTALFADSKLITISNQSQPAIQIAIPSDASVTSKGLKTSIESADRSLRIYLWLIPSTPSIDSLLPKIASLIKSEFLEWTPQSTSILSVAGHPAKYLKGNGEEADDNDPGAAEVAIFTDGKNSFVACVHGEKDHAAKQHARFLQILESIKPL